MFPRISLPLQLLLIIVGVSLFGNLLSEMTITWFYTFSLLFKELLSFILPFIVFAFVLSGILSFKKNAPLVLAIMVGMIFCSNAIVALVSYAVVHYFFPIIMRNAAPVSTMSFDDLIKPFFTISLPVLSSKYVLLSAIGLGLFFSFFRSPLVERSINRFKYWIECILTYSVIPLLPVYVTGFLLKIKFEGTFAKLAQQYGGTCALIVAVQVCYLGWLYFVASGFSVKRAVRAINTAFPSYLAAFSTMSSTAALPVSIDSAEKNTGNRGLSHVAMPIMANIHLLGDAIGTPILAMVTMSLFLGHLPPLLPYLIFVFYFCTTMFAASGIPAGGLIVVIPVLISQLGFTQDMISVITTLYLLLDSFGTAANVMGDGALVMLVNKVLKRLRVI